MNDFVAFWCGVISDLLNEEEAEANDTGDNGDLDSKDKDKHQQCLGGVTFSGISFGLFRFITHMFIIQKTSSSKKSWRFLDVI